MSNTYRWHCPAGHYEHVAIDVGTGVPAHLPRCPYVLPGGRVCAQELAATVTYGKDALRCGFEWGLEDPNEEDRLLGHSHRCRLLPTVHGHRHVCGCAAYIDVDDGWRP